MSAPTPNDAAQLKPIFRLVRGFSDDAPFEALPPHWQRGITRLRRENAKTRIELRDARAELGAAQQRIAALMLDLADVRDELRAQTDGK
jgi:hypothetical protein